MVDIVEWNGLSVVDGIFDQLHLTLDDEIDVRPVLFEIDRFGNINTSCIGDFRHPKVRLPGSGGAADIASMAKRTIASGLLSTGTRVKR